MKKKLIQFFVKLFLLIILPSAAALILGFHERGYFAVGGEAIFPILGSFFLFFVKSEPEPTPLRDVRRAQIGS